MLSGTGCWNANEQEVDSLWGLSCLQGAQSIVRHNAVKQGRKERVCYKYSIYHIMFNELILKGTVHPNITKHWKIWNTPHEFYGLFCDGFMLFFCPFLDLTVSFHFYWMELMWIIMFYEFLDSHSDGTHSLQIIYWWVSNVMLNFSKSVPMKNKKNILNLGWLEDEYIFSNSSFLGELLL